MIIRALFLVVIVFSSAIIECVSSVMPIPPVTNPEDRYSYQVAQFVAAHSGSPIENVHVEFKRKIRCGGIVLYKASVGTADYAVKIESKRLSNELKSNHRFLGDLLRAYSLVDLGRGSYRIFGDDGPGFEARYNSVEAFGWLLPDGAFRGPFRADIPSNEGVITDLMSLPGVSIQLISWIPGMPVDQSLTIDRGNLNEEAVAGVRAFSLVGQSLCREGVWHGDYEYRNVMYLHSCSPPVCWVIDPGYVSTDFGGIMKSFSFCGIPRMSPIIPTVTDFLRFAVEMKIMDLRAYRNWFGTMYDSNCFSGMDANGRLETLARLWPLRTPFHTKSLLTPDELLTTIGQYSEEYSIRQILSFLLLYDGLSSEFIASAKKKLPDVDWTERDIFEFYDETLGLTNN
ncbi:MAG: hypothetical protein LBJ77_03905 [Holosporales bacterium]|nr:hypothetical protein [Holosporales bacterium]